MTDVILKDASEPLLTIIIPTYNRAENLSMLLHALWIECAALTGMVTVMVFDNASSDRTPEVTRGMQAIWPELRIQRHVHNCGAEENFCRGIDSVETRYFWIIGDDDCPRRGVVKRLVELLRQESPALVYLQSEWVNPISVERQNADIGDLAVEFLDPLEFASRVHIWFTFISGNVIDRTALAGALGHHAIRRFTNTSLAQLGWVYPLLLSTGRFAFVRNRCVLATMDNSSGYARLTVFGISFPRITKVAFGAGSRLANIVIARAALKHLPGVIWWARRTPNHAYIPEDPWPGMRDELGGRLIFWLLLVPVGRFPMWLAQPFYQLWKTLDWVRFRLTKLRERRHSVHGSGRISILGLRGRKF
jgi:glycosyltransferase involved in cell wall biosynthesis